MKKVLALLLLPMLAFAQLDNVVSQKEIIPEYITVDLDSTTTSTIYYIFPPSAGITSSRRTAPSTTAPTASSAQANIRSYTATGDVGISVVIDSVTADESDSLYMYINPLFYDATKAAWHIDATHVRYLVFDTADSYTSDSVDYLNWSSGGDYYTTLSNELWPAAGFALTVGQYTIDVAGAYTRCYFGFWTVR